MTALAEKRAAVRRLLDERNPADAVAAYYGLHHDPGRTRIYLHYGNGGRPDGFLVRAQTGYDLFRPLITLRAPDAETAAALLQAGMIIGRPYYLTLPHEFGEVAFRELNVGEPEVMRLYRLDRNRFAPQINVLVTAGRADSGLPFCEIRTERGVHAQAGVNWRSPYFAEVYVYTEPAARGRGWGKAVVSALATALDAAGTVPLYVVAEHNTTSIRLAETVGFVDTGVREFACFATLEPAISE